MSILRVLTPWDEVDYPKPRDNSQSELLHSLVGEVNKRITSMWLDSISVVKSENDSACLPFNCFSIFLFSRNQRTVHKTHFRKWWTRSSGRSRTRSKNRPTSASCVWLKPAREFFPPITQWICFRVARNLSVYWRAPRVSFSASPRPLISSIWQLHLRPCDSHVNKL